MTETLRAAIIGAGPSGFYAAGQLLAIDEPQFAVDLYRPPADPYGLVRSGVAPDHPKIKSVTRAYDKTSEHERFRFFGHVELGKTSPAQRTARPLPRGRLHDRDVDRQAAGHSGRGAPRLARRHRVRRLVQRPPRPLAASRSTGPSRSSSSATATSRSTSRACSRWRRRSSRSPTRPTTRSTSCAPAVEEITILASRGPLRPRSRTPSCSRWASSSGGDVEVVGGELDELSAVALQDADKTRAQRRDPPDYAAREPSRQGDHGPLPLPRLADRAARRRRRPRARRADREQRDRRARRRVAAARAAPATRGDPRAAGVPLDRLHGLPVAGIPFDERRGLIRNAGGRVTRRRRRSACSASTCPAGSSAAHPA